MVPQPDDFVESMDDDHFIDPRSVGFPDAETSQKILDRYLENFHCIFAFVHAVSASPQQH